MDQNQKNHYHMVAAQIMFKVGESEEIGGLAVNAMIITEENKLDQRAIGQAHRAAQGQFHAKMQDASVKVVDVVLVGMIYMGHMTQEEFFAVPDGAELRQQVTDELAKAGVKLQ